MILVDNIAVGNYNEMGFNEVNACSFQQISSRLEDARARARYVTHPTRPTRLPRETA